METKLEPLKLLLPDEIPVLAEQFGTPCFVYDYATLCERYIHFNGLPNAFGLKTRFSVKSNPNRTIIQIFDQLGADFDVSSVWEARRVIAAGVSPDRILMTAQEASDGWRELCAVGMLFDAGSLKQLDDYGRAFPGGEVSIRLNPGFGSGLVKKLTSGGSHSSFGIWVDQTDEAIELARKHNLKITRIHVHIGSGHEASIMDKTIPLALELCSKIDTVDTLNIGGGYKITAFQTDEVYDHVDLAKRIAFKLEDFHKQTSRKLKLELEPGTYLTALAGSLVARVIDKVSTGENGYQFLKLDAGLSEVMRPSYYGALHPLVTVKSNGALPGKAESVIVSGHCCIAGDVLTPMAGNTEQIAPQLLGQAEIGDFLIVERTGGYAASMCIKNFNSYPETLEILRISPFNYKVIRKRQTLEQMMENELDVSLPIPQRVREALTESLA